MRSAKIKAIYLPLPQVQFLMIIKSTGLLFMVILTDLPWLKCKNPKDFSSQKSNDMPKLLKSNSRNKTQNKKISLPVLPLIVFLLEFHGFIPS